MRRSTLFKALPGLALLSLSVACADDGSSGLYEGESASASDGLSAGDGTGADSGAGTGGAGDEGDSAGDTGDTGDTDGTGGEVMPGQLTAGEWRDLDHWPFWLDLLQSEMW